jgi:dihydroorotase-like cyclic amidohydrolase
MSLEQAVALVTSTPARLFGLYPDKGRVGVGADADIAIVALDETFRPSPETLVTRAAGCGIVFDGMALRGRVRSTLVLGRPAYADGRVTGPPGGRFASPRSVSPTVEPV